jgi:hypothetical protein
MTIFPQLALLPQGLQSQLLPLLQQYLLDQQRRREEQEQLQLAILMYLLGPKQQQQHQRWPFQNNSSTQSGALQQILSTLSARSATFLPSINPTTFTIPFLSMTNFGAVTPTPLSSSAPLLPAMSDPMTPMLLLASSPNTVIQNTATGQYANAAVAHGVEKAIGRSDGSPHQSNLNRSSTNAILKPKAASVGRLSDAFALRDPKGRALNLPTLLVMPSDLVQLSSHQTLL